MKAELEILWRPCNPEEMFTNLCLQTAYSMLANAVTVKDKEIRTASFNVILRCIKALRGRGLAVSSAMDMLHKHEHSSSAMSELVVLAHQNQVVSFKR